MCDNNCMIEANKNNEFKQIIDHDTLNPMVNIPNLKNTIVGRDIEFK